MEIDDELRDRAYLLLAKILILVAVIIVIGFVSLLFIALGFDQFVLMLAILTIGLSLIPLVAIIRKYIDDAIYRITARTTRRIADRRIYNIIRHLRSVAHQSFNLLGIMTSISFVIIGLSERITRRSVYDMTIQRSISVFVLIIGICYFTLLWFSPAYPDRVSVSDALIEGCAETIYQAIGQAGECLFHRRTS